MTWTSSSHFRHPWFVSKRKRCETPVDDLPETVASKRRRQCNTLEHGFAYLSIENPATMDVPWTPLTNDSCSSSPADFSAMDSDMLPPQPVYIVEEPTVPEVDMKGSSWYEPEPDSEFQNPSLLININAQTTNLLIRNSDHRFGFVYRIG